MTAEGIDFPVLVEGIEEFYRNVYGCPLLGPIFRGINMVVLRKHVSYFLHNLTMFDSPMSPHQLKYLTRAHRPLIASKGVTRVHFDSMLHHLRDAMLACGADPGQLERVQQKLAPFRATFPPPADLEAAVDSSGLIPHVCATVGPAGDLQQQPGTHASSAASAAAAVAAAVARPPVERSYSVRSSSSGEDSDGGPHLVVVQREGSGNVDHVPQPLHLTHPQLAPLLTRPAAPPTPTAADEPRAGFAQHGQYHHQHTRTVSTASYTGSAGHTVQSRSDSGEGWARGGLQQAGSVNQAGHLAVMMAVLRPPASTSAAAATPAALHGLCACCAGPAPAAPAAAASGRASEAVSDWMPGPSALVGQSRSRVRQWFKRLLKKGSK